MLKALKGVVSRTILIVLLVLGIGTTSVDAVSASTKNELPGLLCNSKSHFPCSLETVEVQSIFPSSRLVAGVMKTQKASLKASPVDDLDPKITAIPQKTNICSEKYVPQVEEKQPEPLVASAAIYATTTPTLTPSISASPTAILTPEAAHSLDADKLFSLVNAKRVQAGLAPLEKNPAVCTISEARAPELQSDVASGYMHRGYMIRKPSFESTENMIYMRSEEEALNWWLNSPVHRSAIYGDYRQSCIVCRGNTCSQIFANVEEKPNPTPTIVAQTTQ